MARVEEQAEAVDLQAAVESACLATCKREGRGYSLRVREHLEREMRAARDERSKFACMSLLAKVEALVEQMELPMDRRTGE